MKVSHVPGLKVLIKLTGQLTELCVGGLDPDWLNASLHIRSHFGVLHALSYSIDVFRNAFPQGLLVMLDFALF